MTTTTNEKLLEMVSNLTAQVTDLQERIKKLEQNISVDGIYLDGAPDYVKMYATADRKE